MKFGSILLRAAAVTMVLAGCGLGGQRLADDQRAQLADSSPIYHQDSVSLKPRPISCPPPAYPSSLQHRGLDGTVILEMVVDRLGRVEPASVRVISSTLRDFEATAVEGVKACRFEPGHVDELPVRVRIRMPVHFAVQR